MPANPRPACHRPSWNAHTNRDWGIQSERNQESQAVTGHSERNWLHVADLLLTTTHLVIQLQIGASKARRWSRRVAAAILSQPLPASCFFGPSLPPVSPSSLCYISPSWSSTQPEQCSVGQIRRPWGQTGRQMEMLLVGEERLTEMFSFNLVWSAILEGFFLLHTQY